MDLNPLPPPLPPQITVTFRYGFGTPPPYPTPCVTSFMDGPFSQHLSGAGSSPAGSVGRDLNLQKLNYQYLTTSVAVVLVVR